jgi:hypothetical protein
MNAAHKSRDEIPGILSGILMDRSRPPESQALGSTDGRCSRQILRFAQESLHAGRNSL